MVLLKLGCQLVLFIALLLREKLKIGQILHISLVSVKLFFLFPLLSLSEKSRFRLDDYITRLALYLF